VFRWLDTVYSSAEHLLKRQVLVDGKPPLNDMFFFTILNITIMADNTTGVTISQLTQTSILSTTDRIEIDRDGGAFSVTYGDLVTQLENSLGINELADALTDIIG
jgi:hypothetical protein